MDVVAAVRVAVVNVASGVEVAAAHVVLTVVVVGPVVVPYDRKFGACDRFLLAFDWQCLPSDESFRACDQQFSGCPLCFEVWPFVCPLIFGSVKATVFSKSVLERGVTVKKKSNTLRFSTKNGRSFSYFGLYDISVRVQLTLRHLRHPLTDVPLQPDSPPDNLVPLRLETWTPFFGGPCGSIRATSSKFSK